MLIVPLGITGNSERIGKAIHERFPQSELYLNPKMKDVNNWREQKTKKTIKDSISIMKSLAGRALAHDTIVFIIPTYSYPNGRWISAFMYAVIKTFDDQMTKKPLVVLNGNRNFMDDFCAAERELPKGWEDNILAKVDMSGTPEQMDEIAQAIRERIGK